MNGNDTAVEVKVERVNDERTSVRFKVYADGKIWLGVSFAKDSHGRVYSLFNCREFYDEQGVLTNHGSTVNIPPRTFNQLLGQARAILK